MNKTAKMVPSDWEHYFNDLKNDLLTRPDIDIKLIKKAFYFAGEAHSSQYRRSGEPYIMHPTSVARIVVAQGLGEESIIAALLHDTVEDTPTPLQAVIDTFGKDVAFLVDSLSHFDETLQTHDQKDVKTLRKILFSMSKDFRTVYIKIADRLHNMSTLQHMKPEKQIKKATETSNIYIGLANNLNLWKWKTQLEDYCMKYLEPQRYKTFEKRIKAAEQNQNKIQDIIKTLSQTIDNPLELHKRSTMEVSNKLPQTDSFIDIQHLYYIIVSCEDKLACYQTLYKLHNKFKAFTPKFKDYISNPKENGYQAIHTTIFTKIGLIDIKIKQKNAFLNSQKHNQEEWVKKIELREKNLKDDSTFHDSIVSEVLNNTIKIYSSYGEEIHIPQGSTVLDALLYLYKDQALFFKKIFLENKEVSLTNILKNNDIIEVTFASTPKKIRLEWFDILKSYESKNRLSNTLGGDESYNHLKKGFEIFKPWMKIFDMPNLEYIYKYYEKNLEKKGYSSLAYILIDLSLNKIDLKTILKILIPIDTFKKEPKLGIHRFALYINNSDDNIIERSINILHTHIRVNLPKSVQNSYYIAMYKNSIKIRYSFKHFEDLLDFIFEIKEKISEDINLRYSL
ncbi:MAG: GTP pyrophosphokinase (EC, (p)ppGpp synthetase II / Guanosine-3',5'-bis(diphosphate) 3'-pyrophosphohydrolase (EC [uncultured Campylobacterales bacterium]|uniref:GTP pyrophosphokinase (EC, (P)ppGpp synthetase II / Guanosine-3',5'-bis(Diphosphate) 3'-pyrophosphohydrolase (EC)) n=1 Tax=uncultured Campylobacterales bacterium TaxID=352960 RepID=A0A6S6S179_9BACT|nr:MAG: GTP pyrophosphokinase (EC, (p)ppGpp synthetase II / Guanosine-3',5'-bis(diphosphate) 3'-pyrophosphohydrolase (EC [uncultured Campylobacterales bacterium]